MEHLEALIDCYKRALCYLELDTSPEVSDATYRRMNASLDELELVKVYSLAWDFYCAERYEANL